MEPLFGALLGLILAVASSAQNNCTCVTNKWTVCAQDGSGNCTCRLVGSNCKVDCSTLTSECLLMKAEMIPPKEKRFRGCPRGLVGNDGIYNPDEDSGICKARQCNQTNTCWCVNTAGVRTGKGDKSLSCGELVRTSWISIELKHNRSRAFDVPNIAKALKHLFESPYKLHPKHIGAVKYDSPLTICLNQNEKSRCDVDIADVAYYFEKDIKKLLCISFEQTLTVSVNGDTLDIQKLWIHVGEKPPEFCMRQLAAGINAVVPLTAVFGITVLIMLRWLRMRKYKKVEIKEMGEIRAPSSQLP
ncbi:LOW QUALITY PROTEIN: tumor-associated calcium signal transducer 2 [Leptosomus discolor]